MTIRLPRRTVLVLILLLAAAGWPPPLARAGTLCVNPGGTGGCYGTISEAVATAADGDTIRIAGGAPYPERLTLTKSVSLVGDDPATTIIDGSAGGQVIRITTAITVTLTNLTIRNGQAPPGSSFDQWGGGIHNELATLTLNNVVVTGNHTGNIYTCCGTGGEGGGISNDSGHLTLFKSQVTSNTTGTPPDSPSGYAAYGGDGGGIINYQGVLMLDHSLVSHNVTGNGAYGGLSSGRGGDGGGVFNVVGSVTLIDSAIRDNTTGNGGAGSPGAAGGDGGGLYDVFGNVSVLDSTISGNQTGAGGIFGGHSGRGAGLFAHGSIAASAFTIAITNSTLSGNATGLRLAVPASGDGGALYAEGAITVTLLNATLAYNDVDPGEIGGGIANFGGTLGLRNSLLAYNVAGNDPNTLHDCSGALITLGYNVMMEPDCSVSPSPSGIPGDQFFVRGSIVDPLADNGGPTQTNALPLGSLAIDAGDNHACPPADQRGFGRPAFGGTALRCDVGAYELYRFGVKLPLVRR